jgi:hypothetical protein
VLDESSVVRRYSNALSASSAFEARLLLTARGIQSVADGLISLVMFARAWIWCVGNRDFCDGDPDGFRDPDASVGLMAANGRGAAERLSLSHGADRTRICCP